jgi:hypothetical protein
MSSHNDSFVASGSSPTGVDFICENHGSVFLLRPISPAAFLSIHENLPADRQMVKKQEREISDAEIATWRSRAESARVETPSGLVVRGKTEEVQKIMVNGADGRIDWKATAQARERTAARMMGRG